MGGLQRAQSDLGGMSKTGMASLGTTTASGSSTSDRSDKQQKNSSKVVLPKALQTAKSVGYGRIVFILGLFGVAAALTILSFHLSKQSMYNIAQGRFDSVAERALVIASLRIEEKKYSANALAYTAAAMNPNSEEWPNVIIPGYDNIASSLRNVTQGEKMVFCPIIHHPGTIQQTQFEEFAYNFIHNVSNFHEYGGISNFGKGIWSIIGTSDDEEEGEEESQSSHLNDDDNRYHDVTGDTGKGGWNSPYNILVPAFQFDEGDHPLLMKNLHQIRNMGMTMDDVLNCSLERAKAGDTILRECGSLTDFVWTAEAKHNAVEDEADEKHIGGHHGEDSMGHHSEGAHHGEEEHHGTAEGHHDGEEVHHGDEDQNTHTELYNEAEHHPAEVEGEDDGEHGQHVDGMADGDEWFDGNHNHGDESDLESPSNSTATVTDPSSRRLLEEGHHEEHLEHGDELEGHHEGIEHHGHNDEANEGGQRESRHEGHHSEEHSDGGEGHDLAHAHGHGHGGDYGGPEAAFVVPIYPQLDNTNLAGFIVSKLIWEEVLAHGFASDVTGLMIVLRTTGGDHNSVHTFDVTDGMVKHVGEGDHYHDQNARFHMEYVINNQNQFNDLTPSYLMEIYSTEGFIESYNTSNHPWIFLIPLIVLIPTILFFVYDLLVWKEFNSKRNMIEAKRQFVRFISHEVRTPLNIVCMGMTLLRDDFASALKLCQVKEEAGVDHNKSTLGDGAEQLEGWMMLSSQISENAEAAVNILTDLLIYDKIQMGTLTLELEVVPIWSVIERTFSEFKIAAMEKKVTFVLDFGPLLLGSNTQRSSSNADHADIDSSDRNSQNQESSNLPSDIRAGKVIGDYIRLSQVLRNLISNGLKFSKERGQLIVRVSEKPISKRNRSESIQEEITYDESLFNLRGQIVVDVIDDGVGMTPEQVQTVFNDGTQFNANKLQAGGGSGLGLNIAKGISEQHNGSLECSSLGLDRGTTFTLSLPLYVNSESPEEIKKSEPIIPHTIPAVEETEVGDPENDEQPLENCKIKILVVDDSVTNRKLCVRLLEKHGHTCVGACDGLEAVEFVKAKEKEGGSFDCILLDYEMPNMNGPDACKEMRNLGCSSYIVGVTGNLMLEDLQHFRECGANWVLPKPFRMEALEQQLVESGVIGGMKANSSPSQSVRVESGTALELLPV